MKRLLLFTSACVLLFVTAILPASSATEEKAFTGEIMDSTCSGMGSHDAMMNDKDSRNAKECTQTCVKGGDKYMLYDAAAKDAYEIEPQEKAKDFAGERVEVKGTLGKDKKLHVSEIKKAS